MLRLSPSLRLSALVVLMLGSSLAQAQYSWIAPNGVRHFSDQPPPPGTPANRILKAPGRPPERTVAAPVVAPAAEQAKPQSTLAQQEAAFQLRQKQRAEQESKEADEAQRRVARAERCESARQVKLQAASGIRQVRFDAKGERVFVPDDEIAAKVAKAEKVLAECS
jgi:hypothetical protein